MCFLLITIYHKYDNGSKSCHIAITQCSAIHPICDCTSVAVSDGVCVCTAGNVERRYLKDARSIPMAATGTGWGQQWTDKDRSLHIEEGTLFLTDSENGATHVAVGSHLQYLVNDQ